MGFKKRQPRARRPNRVIPELILPWKNDDGANGSTFDAIVNNLIEIEFYHLFKEIWRPMHDNGWVLMAETPPPEGLRVITLAYPKSWADLALYNAIDVNWIDGETLTWARYYPARTVVAWHLTPAVPQIVANEIMDDGVLYEQTLKKAAQQLARHWSVPLAECHPE
jgi:hypothetical protein